MYGTNNDLTMVYNSPLFVDIMTGARRMTPSDAYKVNGVSRNWVPYMLRDVIYPSWPIIVWRISAPVNDRELSLASQKESVRKDIERFFGVLQGKFKILRHEMFEWSEGNLIFISQVSVILHNMIVDMAQRRGEVDENGMEWKFCRCIDWVCKWWRSIWGADVAEPVAVPTLSQYLL